MVDEVSEARSSEGPGRVRVILRAVAILEALASGTAPLTVSQLSRDVGLSKSTTHNLVNTLVETGLVTVDDGTRRYRLGAKLAQLASFYSESRALPDLAASFLARLQEVSGETVSLHVRSGDLRVCISQEVSRHAVRRVLQIGEVRPLYAGAAGAVLMSGMPDDELAEYLDRVALVPLVETTLVDRSAILKRVAHVREAGWVFVANETVSGVFAVALPVRDGRGTVVAALVISGPLPRWDPTGATLVRSDLQVIAGELSAALGFRGSSSQPSPSAP